MQEPTIVLGPRSMPLGRIFLAGVSLVSRIGLTFTLCDGANARPRWSELRLEIAFF
jgi:hypothetical protein